ncbi:hypothetical protein Dda3937_00357 [Dickeya dadantii 3937]|uniref:Uncharacterized protein n=1 Tax=Dickeya dadantii (strain 3937) TaxID=198628 RepID=E0SJT0_DICD3|nr:hypothetical protein Dda3937_00357 [Dickeya dadantii 3937]
MPLTRRSRSPQHSFNAGKTLHFALIGFVSNLSGPPAGRFSFFRAIEPQETAYALTGLFRLHNNHLLTFYSHV